MFILYLSQGENNIELAIFESLNNLKSFVKSIPNVEYSEDEYGFNAYIDPKNIPSYTELKYKSVLIPLSKYIFPSDEIVELYYSEITNLDGDIVGIIDSDTNIDGYMINNAELKSYIVLRETLFLRIIKILNEMGYKAERAFAGSQDGEAIIYKSDDKHDWRLLCHMDPQTVYKMCSLSEFELKNIISDLII